MLRYLFSNLLGPPHPKQMQDVKGHACNVVGGCGAGCLCVPERSVRSGAPQYSAKASRKMATRGQTQSQSGVQNKAEYDPLHWGH